MILSKYVYVSPQGLSSDGVIDPCPCLPRVAVQHHLHKRQKAGGSQSAGLFCSTSNCPDVPVRIFVLKNTELPHHTSIFFSSSFCPQPLKVSNKDNWDTSHVCAKSHSEMLGVHFLTFVTEAISISADGAEAPSSGLPLSPACTARG